MRKSGALHPLWSARILEEWARATVKLGPQAEVFARGEIAMLRAVFPNAEVSPSAGLEAGYILPDENDIHVLASAITSGADAIVTFNARDFPRAAPAAEGLSGGA